VVLDGLGQTGDGGATAKVLTTYDDPGNAVMIGVRQVLADAAIDPGAVRLVLHGTTWRRMR
jgi:hypothetical protein